MIGRWYPMSYDDGNPFIEEIEINIRQEVKAGMSDYSYDQGEDNYYNNLLGRGKGDGDVYEPPGKPDDEAEPLESDTE